MNINRKFNSRVFKLWLHHKICVCRNPVLDSGIGLAIQAVFLCLHTLSLFTLVGIPKDLKTLYAFSEQGLSNLYPSWCPKRVKEICVGDFLGPSLSPFSPGNTKWYSFHSSPWFDRASFMLSQLPLTFTPISRIWPCNGNSWPNPASRCQPSCFLDFH